MSYIFYLFFGVAPSIIWLLFYLRKDSHPESNKMVLKIFFYGMLATLPAVFVELGIVEGLKKLTPPFNNLLGEKISLVVVLTLNILIGVALVEELMKYLIVKIKVLNNPEFDEPIDVMIYMIIAALGFAAFENILVLLNIKVFLFSEVVKISVLRFLGATFLHALSSALVGYFLALSFFETKKRTELLFCGLTLAVILHGLYNFSIMMLAEETRIIVLIIILIALALFISFALKKIKKLKAICKV